MSWANILIVDDDEGTRATWSAALETADYKTFLASNAEEASSMLQGLPMDIALVDLRLGDVSGMDLIRQFRPTLPDLQFVLVSGFLSVQIAVEAMKLGATTVLEKPVETTLLLDVLTEASQPSPRSHSVDTDIGLYHKGLHDLKDSLAVRLARWA